MINFIHRIIVNIPALVVIFFSAICISSTETIGGISIGFFAKKGRLIAVIKIKALCKTEDIIKLLFT